MKKIIALLTASMLALTACNAPATQTTSDRAATESNNVLKFYNWGEYIGEDVISRFEDEYNAKVICEYYDSNEMMYTKLQAGDKYDVLIPSDYMIERLLNEDMLQPINKDEIPNMSNLTDSVKNLSYDSDNTYSVPFFQGSVGIVYNKTKISPEEIKNQGWEILR
ncbi:MAG TPA: ABC transporter substrate-binding protein, partial [Lachnospiraceae bacterium]|nr:ABC transporter substrate-binding protein [Lachnospiraceae bacterium]